MLYTDKIKHKVALLNLAEELGNISACQVMGLSRGTFLSLQKCSYRGWRGRLCLKRFRRNLI